jgi:predicted AAA+ superfamily ATPase
LCFSNRWRTLGHEPLSKEDLRGVPRVRDLGAIEVLMRILEEHSGQQLIYASLAAEISVAVDTARRWVDPLGRLHFGFLVQPRFKNETKSPHKEPTGYPRDRSGISEEGARAETMVACHLLKAIEGWIDLGVERFELRYLRDKLKREVEFLVARDGRPWFLVEVRKSDADLFSALAHFQVDTRAEHAFQVLVHLPNVAGNCFASRTPVVVPARTALSQLI